jgi:peptide deformylase
MAVRPIRIFGDPVLRSRAAEVSDFDRSIDRVVSDLCDTLVDAGGAGLAAPQIGVGLRAFAFVIVDKLDPDYREVRHIINPVLVEQDDEQLDDIEGCLSIPGLSYNLPRPRRIVATGFDRHGEPLRIEGTERLARCLAHETDHLDGVLFVDRLDPETRKRAMGEIREMLLAGEDIRVKPSPHAPPNAMYGAIGADRAMTGR